MRIAIALLPALIAAAPSLAQSMPGMAMPSTPAKPAKAAPAHAARPRPARPAPAPPAHATMPAMPGMAMEGMTMSPAAPPDGAPAGTALPAGDAPTPPVPTGYYADRRFDPDAMTAARARMMGEEGGAGTLHQILFNLAELQIHDGRAGYRWDGEAWVGRDLSRLVVKSEGEGGRDGVDAAEVQALYARAIGPYFNAQAGIRQDIAPTRTYATIGVEGLAPYAIETEAAMFLSTRGELLGRIEGWYDARITQRLMLQPRVELNLAAQDLRDTRVGAGLSDAELGLRLRYEIAREFAPYLGISYEAKTGHTADLARAAGRDVAATNLVIGTRFWF